MKNLLITVILLSTLISSVSQAMDYKAIVIDNNLLVTNGKYSYLLKTQKLMNLLSITKPQILVKVYGTEIWVVIDKDKTAKVLDSKFKNYEYFVLAPITSQSEENSETNYEAIAQGNSFNSTITYPNDFCMLCARPSKLNADYLKSALAKILPEENKQASSKAKPAKKSGRSIASVE